MRSSLKRFFSYIKSIKIILCTFRFKELYIFWTEILVSIEAHKCVKNNYFFFKGLSQPFLFLVLIIYFWKIFKIPLYYGDTLIDWFLKWDLHCCVYFQFLSSTNYFVYYLKNPIIWHPRQFSTCSLFSSLFLLPPGSFEM